MVHKVRQMVNVRKYNPVLRNRLQVLVETSMGTDFVGFFAALTNAERRTAGYLLGTDLLPAIPQAADFFRLFYSVVPLAPKAFLGTFLKAWHQRYEAGCADVDGLCGGDVASCLTAIDRRKVLAAILPVLRTAGEVAKALDAFGGENTEHVARCLVDGGSASCYYELFRLLRRVDDNRDFLRRCCLLLMRRGDSLSFNMACVIRQYFDVPELPGTFSLRLKPYQLGRMDLSEEAFLKILQGQG